MRETGPLGRLPRTPRFMKGGNRLRERKNPILRYMLVVSVFCLVCVIYLGRLFYIQISGRENTYDTGTTTRVVTVQAARGEIYDRNGNALVTNRFSYDLTLSYSVLASSGLKNSNQVCLSLLGALEETDAQDTHVEKFFPFEGTYPYYLLSEEAQDADSIPYYRMRKVLKAIGLNTDASIADIVKYYTSTYDLLATDKDGTRLFDDDEIDRLIRLRYDMDAQSFKSTGSYTFAKNVELPLMTYVKELALSGVTFTVTAERVYNYPGYASHILGTVGPIYSEEWDYYNEQGYQMNAIVGKSGCEFAFEEYLRGIDGTLIIEEDANGNVVSVTVKKQPVAGSDVHLTIDIDLQIAAEDGLRENVEAVGGNCNAGAAVAMDPNTFEVLAIASYPTYDLSTYNLYYNELASDSSMPLLNRALNGTYAPGSTFKPGVAAAALTDVVIYPSDRLKCTGTYDRYHHPKCSTKDYHSSTYIDLVEAIADSCNCYFYELGYRLGIDRMKDYMAGLGFGEATGLELGGAKGSLASPEYRQQFPYAEPWQEGDVLSASIGQSDTTATPIQLASYLSALVSGGTRYNAHLLHSVYAFGSEEPSYVSEQRPLSSVSLAPAHLSTILEGMRQVVTGSNVISRNMKNVPVPVGGKTGTAQNGSKDDNALFVCAAPYDAPEIVISVVLEQGVAGGNSSLTAARILERYYRVGEE